MTKVHQYPVSVRWTGGRDGTGTLVAQRSGHTAPLGVAPEYGGPGQGTNPEELLVSAVAGCYSITLGILAAHRKVPVTSIEVQAVGEVDQDGLNFTYARIDLRARVVLEPAAADQQVTLARELAHKADLYCLVTNAVRGKVQIGIEADVVRG